VGRAAAVLAQRRLLLGGALLAALAAYYYGHTALPGLRRWPDVAFLALVLIPAVFALMLVALPARRWRWLPAAGIGAAVLAAACDVLDWEVANFFFKVVATTALGFWFLGLFEALWWAVLVACIIPLVDAYSVWRGPTRHIVEEREEVFVTLSVGFPVWGDEGTANLGLPDLFFFAIFLAAAARWNLRVWWTWLAMALSFGTTLAIAVRWDLGGLPALPVLCVGFLLPNADLLWREVRRAWSARGERPG
jgi:hypothetical protein